MTHLRPEFKLWLNAEDAPGAFGDGKWRLLEAVEELGSLAKACKSLRISYRKAWGDLKKSEQCLGIALIKKERGGRAGGQTSLTEQGRNLIKAYRQFRRNIERTVDRAYEKYIQKIVE